MKKVLFFASILMVFTYSISFAFQYGSPEPTAKAGSFAVQGGYYYNTNKLEGFGDSFDMKSHNAYFQGNFGILKDWEIYGRVGAANMKVKELFTANEDFNDKAKFFASAGFKGVFYRMNGFSLGLFGQASYYTNYKDDRTVKAAGGVGTWDMKLKNLWDLTGGIGFQAKFSPYLYLYGGPFVYLTQVDACYTSTVPGQLADTTRTLKGKNNFGGFLGLAIPLTKKISLNLEGQVKTNISGGAAISYAF
ncbi:MAG: hypothetical protein N2745_04330 [Syntrophorhabdaceae bacterium]|nr:hypothetical protein [Syntrophorhabdaceae bacterium]